MNNTGTNKVTGENNATVELLAEMHRNVTMGSENLSNVVPKIKDKFMLSNVTSQIETYAEFAKQTEKQLNRRGIKPKDATPMKKVMSKTGIEVNTLFDSSDAHIAEMIEKGTRMGMKQLAEKRTELEKCGCDGEVCKLCGDILAFERRETNKIKDYM